MEDTSMPSPMVVRNTFLEVNDPKSGRAADVPRQLSEPRNVGASPPFVDPTIEEDFGPGWAASAGSAAAAGGVDDDGSATAPMGAVMPEEPDGEPAASEEGAAGDGGDPRLPRHGAGRHESPPAAAEGQRVGGRSGGGKEQCWAGVTTVMMRNLPNKYTQQMLLEEIHDSGFQLQVDIDFFYLPMDHANAANLGYCFMNFTSPGVALSFVGAFQGRKMRRFNSTKTIVVMPASIQGYEQNFDYYSLTRVATADDPAYRPLFLRPLSRRAVGVRKGQQERGCAAGKKGGKGADEVRWQWTAGSGKGGAGQQESCGGGAGRASGPLPQPKGGVLPTLRLQALLGEEEEQTQQQKQQEPQQQPHQRMHRFCPFCGQEWNPNHKFCPFCGNERSATTAPAAPGAGSFKEFPGMGAQVDVGGGPGGQQLPAPGAQLLDLVAGGPGCGGRAPPPQPQRSCPSTRGLQDFGGLALQMGEPPAPRRPGFEAFGDAALAPPSAPERPDLWNFGGAVASVSGDSDPPRGAGVRGGADEQDGDAIAMSDELDVMRGRQLLLLALQEMEQRERDTPGSIADLLAGGGRPMPGLGGRGGEAGGFARPPAAAAWGPPGAQEPRASGSWGSPPYQLSMGFQDPWGCGGGHR